MTYVPPASGRARAAGTRRHLARVAVAAVAGCAALIGALSSAAPVAGVEVQTARVGVIVSDGSYPPGSRGSTWGRVTSSPAGIDCPGACAASFPIGSVVVLRAQPKQDHTFQAWTVVGPGESCNMWAPACSLTITGDVLANAVMQETGVLETVIGAGKVVVAPVVAGRRARSCAGGFDGPHDCRQTYKDGTRVTFRAVADAAVPGARFVGWSDYRCDGRLSCTLPMRGEHQLTATFEPFFLRVFGGDASAVSLTPPGRICTFGSDPAASCTVPYPRNTLVTLRRPPRPVDVPSSWDGGGCDGPALSCMVRMRKDVSVVAGVGGSGGYVVAPEVIWLEYGGPRGGRISIRPLTLQGSGAAKQCRRTCSAGGFGHGDQVEIRAQAGPGVKFRRWADSKVRTSVRRLRIGARNPVKAIFARR